MKQSQVHIICGLTGAGKSTYAEVLRKDLGGVRFSIDDWNAGLFYVDRSPASDFDWFYDRVQRSCALMRQMAEQVISAGVPVIFDCGFTNLKERQIFYDWAAAQGYTLKLHFLDVAPDVRWQRVQRRNSERGETYIMQVDRGMFDFMQKLWEAPAEDEMALYDGQPVTN